MNRPGRVCPKAAKKRLSPSGRAANIVHLWGSAAKSAAPATAEATAAAAGKSTATAAAEAAAAAAGEPAATAAKAAAAGTAGESTAPGGAAAGAMEAVKAAGTARSARTSGTSGGRRRRPPPAPLVPAIAGTVPEQDRPEYIGGIDHPVIPLTVAGIAQGVQNGGDHHQDDHQGDHAYDGVSSAVVGRAAFAEIAQAVLVHVEFIDAGEQLDHAVAELAGHGVLIGY